MTEATRPKPDLLEAAISIRDGDASRANWDNFHAAIAAEQERREATKELYVASVAAVAEVLRADPQRAYPAVADLADVLARCREVGL